MIIDIWFYAAALPAILVSGVSKGGFGGGVVVLSVPLMSLAVPPQQAAAIMLPILMAMDVMTVWVYRRAWDGRHLRIVVPASVIGVAVGWASFGLMNEAMVKLLLAAIALAFSLDFWFQVTPKRPPSGPDVVRGGLSGALAGFTSFVAHAGGPPLNAYMLPQGLEKRVFVGTVAIFFAAVNWLKVLPYGMLGQFNTENLSTSLVLLPLAPAGIALGLWLQNRVPGQHFYRVCYVLLFVTGVKLAWDGVSGLI